MVSSAAGSIAQAYFQDLCGSVRKAMPIMATPIAAATGTEA
ncbi:MAG: hypothetical protein QF773_02090 [Lentisphaeria bacterium]|nr:hypothetical protein [Lentisphaeria bacterium]